VCALLWCAGMVLIACARPCSSPARGKFQGLAEGRPVCGGRMR
jgi:hypothetical protein